MTARMLQYSSCIVYRSSQHQRPLKECLQQQQQQDQHDTRSSLLYIVVTLGIIPSSRTSKMKREPLSFELEKLR